MWADNIGAAPDIKEARELAFKSSPVASIANWRSPMLLVHGDDDRNVPFQQTTDLVEKLRSQNVVFEELIFPDEIHDLLRWSDLGPRLPRHRRILRPKDGCSGERH